VPILGVIMKKYVVLMAKLRTNSIPSLIETYFLVFVIAPLFNFNCWILIAGIISAFPFLGKINSILK